MVGARRPPDTIATMKSSDPRQLLDGIVHRQQKSLDSSRVQATEKRKDRGYRTARENLEDLVDSDSFVEYGQLAVAAQRGRRNYEELQLQTPGDGIITGTATINAELVGVDRAATAVIVNDYSVLAGTQGYFHHQKLDRICEIARQDRLPAVMYAEGGGGRPGDVDVTTQIAGLNVETFTAWAGLPTPKIAVANGYCFAGNAALFGSADIRIATRSSWIGMAGPAMIEGGGLGKFSAKEIGPTSIQETNGVVHMVCADEAEATMAARRILSVFQGPTSDWQSLDQATLRDLLPDERRWTYPIRPIIEHLVDIDSLMELRPLFGRTVVTALARIAGRPIGVIANDCQHLGGAIDTKSARKLSEFLQLCDRFQLPVLSLVDTPGFMVGPESEQSGAVTAMSTLFRVGAELRVPLIALFLRKAYGLGAMAMVGGSFRRPRFAAAWPTGEFGGMGLEGAVRLGYRRELDAITDNAERKTRFDELVAMMYEKGKATEAAAFLEIDAVIDPASSREAITRVLQRAS